MVLKGFAGIMSMGLGGAILVYSLSRVIMDAGYKSSIYFAEGQNLLWTSSLGGFIALVLIGAGLWLIVHDKLGTQTNSR